MVAGMSIILTYVAAYCAIVVILALFIVFMIQTKRWEIIAVECGETDCDLKCETCSCLPTYMKEQAD